MVAEYSSREQRSENTLFSRTKPAEEGWKKYRGAKAAFCEYHCEKYFKPEYDSHWV